MGTNAGPAPRVPGWRNLCESQPKLARATRVATVSLHKQWSKKPSYWIDIYARAAGEMNVFSVWRQWSYMKAEEGLITGEVESNNNPIATIFKAVEEVVSLVSHQIKERDYTMSTLWYDHDGFPSVEEIFKRLLGAAQLDVKTQPIKTASAPKTDKEKLADTIYERERKAKW